MKVRPGDMVRMYNWPEDEGYYKVIWIDDLAKELCLAYKDKQTSFMYINEMFWVHLDGPKVKQKGGIKSVNKSFDKAIRYKRGESYCVIVGVNFYTEHVSFQDLKVPDNADEDVVKTFLDEAEKELAHVIDKEWEKYNNLTHNDSYYTKG